MIPYTAYSATETRNAFEWARQPPKLPLSVKEFNPYLIHGFLGSQKSATLTASRSVQLFLHSKSVHKHTDHAMCDICRNRPHLCYVCGAV